jgi:hypothetical protein
MTEAEWLACEDPQAMVAFALESMSARKRRLLSVARARMVWHLMTDGRSRDAVEVAERHADGAADEHALTVARDGADGAQFDVWEDRQNQVGTYKPEQWDASLWAYWAVDDAYDLNFEADMVARMGLRPAALAGLLRDLVRHPASPGGRLLGEPPGPDAGRMARHAYDARDWGVLPVLADALEEQGCADDALLSHMRSEGPHVRGCWALDLILGKG